MTLLELPVKELPKRGGWLAIFRVFPDCNVAEKFISDFKVSYGTDSNCDQYIESEETGEILTREQYEAAIAAQQPVWNGEGLPPVGAKVESFIDGEWKLVKVVYVGEPGGKDEALVFDVKTTKPVWADELRPIRTEAERKREEFVSLVIGWMDHATPAEIEFIYDKIAAGKIPGVELSK